MKKSPTTLPIDVVTDYEHAQGNDFERARQQIEHAGLYLQSIFNTIKRSALHTDGEFAHDESDTVRNFCGDLIHFSEIGNALLMLIWKNVSEMETPLEVEENEIEKVETVKVAAPLPPRQSAEIASLALQLSAVLNNQNLPVEIYNGVMNTVGEIYNKGDNEILNRFESSPEYLKALLLAYAKSEAKNDE